MPVLIQFGAGNIGRGFIAPTFAAAGWEVVFIDVAPGMVAELNARRAYQVIEVDGARAHAVRVGPVRAIDGRDLPAVTAAIATCDLAATAVGLGALRHLGAPLAAGLAARDAGRPLDVLVCENGVQAPDLLRAAIAERLPTGSRAALLDRLGLVRTSIGRMIPAATGGDLLDIRVEPYAHLPVEQAAFRGPLPAVAHLEPRADFDLVLLQKLYLHNLTHACLAYAGHLAGFATIPDCADDPALAAAARAAGDEAGEALARAHGGDVVRVECRALLDDLFVRYRNRALADPVARVARDPWRKLAGDDRLIGAARLCHAQGVVPAAIARHIIAACHYEPADDEPRAVEWRALRAQGPLVHLAVVAGLTSQEPLMSTILFADRQTSAATSMRQAGIVLRDDEAAAIEIADFGLDRFDQFGLAIHVYVNTDRCCAKELVMLPGQICPEHRHPSVDGEIGKEETFRVRQGEVHLFLPGNKKDGAEEAFALGLVPADKRGAMTVYKHVHLRPGDQYTLKPNTPHWFAAGAHGAIVSEFSTRSRDEADIFTDAAIKRVPDPA